MVFMMYSYTDLRMSVGQFEELLAVLTMHKKGQEGAD